ncbi:MAG TPA: bifunctional 2-C-methyl-D-erythritol 4-phosphate cytidylyltransferase/2-C-methyl-D-erythritol 2,4-cyclodiphosphate synthase, partial [Alphaproteobacteria bacterium]|nr:bifunctional 2-C-methyl-D-erythritol 4-phosphate cytidylyltransferase/2-C-methyl-D-erythritol 2,4-cyclodiphosphate synthase [Alphaproteobacteria bacterium]
MPTTAAIIVAAGKGIRAGGGVPKQYRPIAGQPVLRHTIFRFVRHPGIGQVIVVIADEDRDRAKTALAGLDVMFVTGGATRTASVRAGLDAVPDGVDLVLIHDGARPFVPAALIDAVLEGLD